MIEKFDNRRLTGQLSVKCKNDDGTSRTWVADKAVVVTQIVQIVDEMAGMGHTLTLRQLHYQFVSRNWIVNHITAYKKLGKILDDCRYGGVIDWDAIEDRGRSVQRAYFEDSVSGAIQRTYDCYKLNRQAEQLNHVEVWTEKDALSAILGKAVDKYTIPLAVNKGYTSSSAIYEAYKRFCDKINNGQKVVILYFGDHDPSGLDMIRDVRERLTFMFENGDEQLSIDEDNFEVVPIGLTMKQIKQFKLPPNPAKLTDSRSDAYIKLHGSMSWEVDALHPNTLVEIVDKAIRANIDYEVYTEQLEKETKDRVKLLTIIKKHK